MSAPQPISLKSNGNEPAQSAIHLLQRDLDSGLFKALSEPTRQRIVSVLLQHGRLSIMQIKAYFPQDRSVVSRHLKFLRECGLVVCTQEGRYSYYELSGSEIMRKLQSILGHMQVLMRNYYPEQWASFEKQQSEQIAA
ncbi:hypothetical protein GCM10007860_02590 [Chitiniphilus shinanonensis]|uniref:HTH arsR-type domain-containing protein n=1 Tax=Chitiniphilus shinanonensis TaxID=553088 RepID=A0ABQ6BRH2_9NEIS|nr:metalloregulator ArsR/SmtB family transcription factor [Chitiniphilus shinanonensis]GLS03116.1 hypothetical protein GCM10007860_02590 [Chitiniphilus shinanonensis]